MMDLRFAIYELRLKKANAQWILGATNRIAQSVLCLSIKNSLISPSFNRNSYLVNRTSIYFAIIALSLFFTSCYSFKEGRIPPEIQTVKVFTFTNQSSNGNTQLNQGMTDALRNRFITQSNLRMLPVDSEVDGDIEFRGSITGYTVLGTAAAANQTTALSRLTLTVKIDFVNNTKPGDQWSQSFSRFADYSSTQNLLDVEAQLLQDIYFQLVEDIYNKALVNW
jgi:hypothetical protein